MQPVVFDVKADNAGFVSGIETRNIGLAVVALGGGRTRPQDEIDHAVGITAFVPFGAQVSKGEALARIHARTQEAADAAAEAVKANYVLAAKRPALTDPVIRRIGN